jgi:transaldolase / glucose-6-phosphate isomerase
MPKLQELNAIGQSVWLDYMRRDMLDNGELARWAARGLRGVTSNPAIFAKAITGSNFYDAALAEAKAQGGDAKTIYERLAVRDIRDAADVLRPVYDITQGRDGYVSLEVSPHLAEDDFGTIAEANRLWAEVDRPNLMIKVPGTPAGIDALGVLIRSGININVTLLFSVEVYRRVANTYIEALEARAEKNEPLDRIASVASFFVSRIDTAADTALEAKGAGHLAGKTAIANAKTAYEVYRELFGGSRWRALAGKGAQAQRLLWASTGTKNPNYSDVLYVEALIGPETVNTLPPATLEAFLDHGKARETLTEDLGGAKETLQAAADAGVSLEDITARLLDEGLKQFAEPFDQLLAAIEGKKTLI